MSGGAFVDGLDVDVGAYTKASDHDKLADNTEFCREKTHVGHDLDIATGDGYHRGLFSAPVIFKIGASAFFSLWGDDTDPNDIVLRTLRGASAGAVTPGGKTEGRGLQLFERMSSGPI